MSLFHQKLREDLKVPKFAEAFYDMNVDIALLQVLEQARKTLDVSEKELAERTEYNALPSHDCSLYTS